MTATTPRDPATMSDDELRRACVPLPSEADLERVGCMLPLFVSAIMIICVALFVGRFVGGFAVVIGGVVLYLVLAVALFALRDHLAGSRRRPFREELDHRYGLSPLSRYVDEERIAHDADRMLASSLFLRAAALPHGGFRYIRIRIWRTPEPRADVEVRTMRWRHGDPRVEHAELVRGEAELPSEARAEIEALLDAPGPAALSALRSGVYDGSSCTVMVLRRGVKRVHCGSCNLSGLSPETRDHPTVRFAQAMLRAAAVVEAPPLMTGSCDAQGNITIDTI